MRAPLAVAAALLFVVCVLPLSLAAEIVEDASDEPAVLVSIAPLPALSAGAIASIDSTPHRVTSPFWIDRDDVIRR